MFESSLRYSIKVFPWQNGKNARPTRARPVPKERARPYQNRNAEAGPSTMTPRQKRHAGVPTSSSGRILPETTAYANKITTTTEEDRVLVSNFYHPYIPRVADRSNGRQEFEDTDSDVPRPDRRKRQKDGKKLCDFVKRWKGLTSCSLNKALACEKVSQGTKRRT